MNFILDNINSHCYGQEDNKGGLKNLNSSSSIESKPSGVGNGLILLPKMAAEIFHSPKYVPLMEWIRSQCNFLKVLYV